MLAQDIVSQAQKSAWPKVKSYRHASTAYVCLPPEVILLQWLQGTGTFVAAEYTGASV